MQRARLINTLNWVTLGLMAASLPTSKFTFSMFQFILAALFVADGVSHSEYLRFFSQNSTLKKIVLLIPYHLSLTLRAVVKRIRELPDKKIFFVFLLFYLVHLAGVLYSENLTRAISELRIKLPMVLIPLFVLGFREVRPAWRSVILLVFAVATLVATLVSAWIFFTGSYTDIRQISPFIHHINFSLFVVFSMFMLLLNPFGDFKFFRPPVILVRIIVGWFFLYLLAILKSLTGLIILFSGLMLILMMPRLYSIPLKPWASRLIALTVAAIIAGSTALAVWKFYDIEPVDFQNLDSHTALGNPYWHDTEERVVENGHYIYIYISDEELRPAWNAVSEIDYDGPDRRGQDLRYTLYRYMTALGLRKDADGFQQLDEQDIRHVENGIANHLYTSRFAIYPRIYQTIWEYDVYRKTGSFAEKSSIQRLASLGIGLDIIKSNPVIGVGTGDVTDAYMKRYMAIAYDEQPTRFITGANQWLNFAVAFGVTGLLIIGFSLISPALKRHVTRSPLFLMFLFISALAMMGEDTMRYQTGLTFFAFFYAFFVFLVPRKGHFPKEKIKGPVKNVLAIQTAFIGDLVMTTPLLAGLKNIYPNAAVDLVVNSGYTSLVANNPSVRHVYGFDKSKNKVINLLRLIRVIKNGRYDLAVSMQRHLSSSLMMFLGGINKRVGSSKQWMLTHPVVFPKGIHTREKAGMLLKEICDGDYNLQTRLYPSESDKKAAERVLTDSGRFRLGVAPGSVWETKKWPKEYYIETIKKLGGEVDVYLIGGGQQDTDLCHEIVKELAGQQIINLAGQLSLLQSAALIGQLDLLLCNDSAPLHMANAMQTPVFAIFGPTVKQFGCYPYQPHDKMIEIDLYCRPCARHGGNKCPEGHFRCMKEITPKHVIMTIRQFIQDKQDGAVRSDH